ncbi:MAG: SDR family NAD(P)-dependent oxidoreductase [Victivallaceae bacterium]|nr:SDR family NAD(P)-dependent oxidoreductase [Victivallaceae bacterium]
MKTDLNGKVALVTGAARGIGKAIADTLAANGALVVYADISPTLEQTVADIPNGTARHLDVTDAEDIAAGIEWLVQKFGGLDILVNNAGVNTAGHRVTLEQFPREEWDWIVNTDLTGCYLVTKAAAPAIFKRGGGRIINIASVFGLVPARLQCAFAAAKAGVVNLTKAMALEFAERGVLVNAIAPGSIPIAGSRGLFSGKDPIMKGRLEGMLSHIPLHRFGKCEDIANAALFLAAPENDYITGSVVTVDGGWTAGYSRDF